MSYTERLKAVPLFAGLSDEDLERVCAGVNEITLEPGEQLFQEGERGDVAYVIVDGEIEVFKTSAQRDVLLSVQGPGEVIGEMALLQTINRSASGKARGSATLLSIPQRTLNAVLDASPSASREMFDVILQRWRSTEVQLRQSERMAQLGTLSAGLAHELNNPAAAARRSASMLEAAIADQMHAYVEGVLAAAARPATVDQVLEDVRERVRDRPALDPLARADLEVQLEAWLEAQDVAEPWTLAPSLADGGYTPEQLGSLLADCPGPAIGPLVGALVATHRVHELVHEIQEGTGRLSAIVGALKSYAYLDQAPVQDVDITRGLDDTLLILKHKLNDIDVTRSYAPELPTIEAYGSELNQVWTNLIDNAADALLEEGPAEKRIDIRALPHAGGVAVEIEDNGPGIPEDVIDCIFDSFFTTKPPGSGTGLGLDITRNIVVSRHGGDIRVTSQPGSTRFRVELPARLPG